jgi:hypothetical protein
VVKVGFVFFGNKAFVGVLTPMVWEVNLIPRYHDIHFMTDMKGEKIGSLYDAYDEKCRIALYKYSLALAAFSSSAETQKFFHIFTNISSSISYT